MWSAIPFLVAAAAMIVVATHSDRTGERRLHVAACTAIAACGLMITSLTDAPIASFTGLVITAIGVYGFTPPFWQLPTAFLRGDGAAAGIGLINSVGNLGGFVGPYVMGWAQGASGDFHLGLRVLAASAICSGLVVLAVRSRQSSEG
jgi:nitrate/nitrite transporter NarK